MSAGFQESWDLLRRNPNLTKAVFAAGFLISATVVSPAATLVVTPLKAELWGQRMSQYGALVQALMNGVAIVFSGIFGRWSDSVNRRTAVVVVGVIAFMPHWSLLPLLLLEMRVTALYTTSVLLVISGVVCLSATACPTMYALLNDIIHPKDQELAFGICYAVSVATILVSNLAGVLISMVFPGESVPLILFNILLTLVFFALVASIDMTKPDDETDGSSSASNEEASSTADPLVGDSKDQPSLSFLAPIKLACGHAALRNTCIVFALVGIPETACLDINTQYVLDLLGLLESPEGSEAADVQVVQSLLSYPGQFLLIPAFYVAGVLAQRVGALSLSKSLIIAVAAMQASPLLLMWVPYLWAVAVEGTLVTLTFTVFLPLQTVVAQVAPRDRVGEALSAAGASKQFAALVGNGLVTFLSPVLLASSIPRPLSLIFPFCGVMCLVAMPFAARIEIPEDAE